MMFSEIGKNVLEHLKHLTAPALFEIKKHSPEILVCVGGTSIVAGTVMACKATLKAADSIDDALTYEKKLTPEDFDDEAEYVENSYELGRLDDVGQLEKKDAAKLVLNIVRIYSMPSALIAGGICMMVAAKSIEHRRFVAAIGTVTSLQAMIDEYRARVAKEYGEEAERKLYLGEASDIIEVEGEAEDGKKPKKEKLNVKIMEPGANPYLVAFDMYNAPTTWQANIETNRYFLECQQRVWNDDLNRNGRVMLNDVRKSIGLPYIPEGQILGWLASDIEESKDGYIDFGIDYAMMREEVEKAQTEKRRPNATIWLNFNCDGVVWEKPLKKKREKYLD